QSESYYGIILLSVDNLNTIKTQYNLKTANKALAAIANELSQNIRETDLIGRYSESEFILILSDVNQTQAQQIALRLTDLINNHEFKINNKVLSLKTSCGVSVSGRDSMSSTVLQQADEALYMAKTNRHQFYSSTGVRS
ncbi:GGDEF domain-containing protein, partial [Acinetobacter bereziniae]